MLKAEHQNILRYIAKCVAGCFVMFAVGHWLKLLDISWVLISMLLILSPDGNEAIPLTFVRVKANLVASAVTLATLLLGMPMLVTICFAVTVTIVCCYTLKLMDGSRAALAAVVIIALHPLGEHLWSTGVERVASVAAGCVLALILTFAFHRGITLGHLLHPDKYSE